MTDEQLLRRAKDAIRRRLFKPPSGVTPWAHQVCCENLISATQLYEALLRSGECFSSAYRLIYGTPDYEQFGDDWRGFVRQKRAEGKSLEYIAMLVRAWWGRSCATEIRRICDDDARAKQREYAARYREKHREKIRERDREFYHRNRERILAARRKRRRNTPRVPKPTE